MASAPHDLTHSPCCNLPMSQVAAGMCHTSHYRCTECKAVFVWSGKVWVPCQNPDEHLAITHKELPRIFRGQSV